MSKCYCSSENYCGRMPPKKLIAIDFLFLDAIFCRCQDTEKSLDEAVSKARKDEAEHQRKGSDTI